MKRLMKFFCFCVMAGTIFSSCQKNDQPLHRNGGVELYLLSSFKTIGNTNQIDESTIISSPLPLVTYSEIQYYDATTCTFKISDSAKEAIKGIKHSVFGVAFALKVNQEVIYTGYFWPSYSSATCAWVVIDPFGINQNNEVDVRIGYPGLIAGQTIPDKRNDPRLLDILKRDNKLHQ